VGLAASAFAADMSAPPIDCPSPSGNLHLRIAASTEGRLTWSLQRGTVAVMLPSPLGLTVDGVDLGAGITLGQPATSTINESFPMRGGKPTATNHCRSYSIPVTHRASGTVWSLEVRVFDDGGAWRYRVPGRGRRMITGEASSWMVPDGVWAWYQTNTANYEGVYQRGQVAEIPRTEKVKDKERSVFVGPPVTVELPGGGYALITEANLRRYSGMALRPTGTARLEAAFSHDLKGFNVDDEIVTPWRVTLVTSDLNSLVNCDVVAALADPPDPRLFPQGGREAWIRPGRALVTWCVFGNEGAQWQLQRWFVDQCAALHCEFLLLDGAWRSAQWGFLADGADPWARLRELCAYGREKGVGIVVWHAFPEGRKDGPGLTRPEARDELFARCREAGVKGVKIDFFDKEGKEVVEAWEDLSRRAAENQMTINFHGANKPTGETRTWPNHITREGIREQEYVLWGELPLAHYAALPFTRFVAGHGDFLPGYVRAKYLRNTRATFQMATAVVATSPFLCWPDHPDDYRASVFLGVVQAMPVVWDETRVLAGSAIGRRVVFARRAGTDWFVAALNCEDQPGSLTLNLDFLPGDCSGTLYRDRSGTTPGVAVDIGKVFSARSQLELELPSGGGFLGWFKPAVRPK
jgi:alpha-glucosidase